MPFDFAALKAQARRAVHDTLAVDAVYEDAHLPEPVGLRVRWHNKISRFGDIENIGYSEIIEGINRVIFDREELNEKGIMLRRGGRVTLTAPQYEGAVLVLDSQEPHSGPINLTWLVSAL
jgi:hypothetical protein